MSMQYHMPRGRGGRLVSRSHNPAITGHHACKLEPRQLTLEPLLHAATWHDHGRAPAEEAAFREAVCSLRTDHDALDQCRRWPFLRGTYD